MPGAGPGVCNVPRMPTPERLLIPTRGAHKAVTDRAALNSLLDTVLIAHVGVSLEEGPLVLPCAFARDDDRLLLHGSTGSRWMRAAADGLPVCITVTELSALVVARSAFRSSMHYRSACLFGVCGALVGADGARELDLITDRLIPGRVAELRPNSAKELAATMVLALPIDQWSLKISDAWPDGSPDDEDGDTWAGVVPLLTGYAEPVRAPGLRPGIAVPASVERLIGPHTHAAARVAQA